MSETVAVVALKRITEWGVKRIYGYPGDGINGIIAAIDRREDAIDFVQVRHEEQAAVMAWRPREVHRRVGRMPRNVRAGRDPSAERPVRCEERPRAGPRAVRAIGDQRD